MFSTTISCPCCHNFTHRIKRKMVNRLMSLFKPVRRYHCNFFDWEGAITLDAAVQLKKVALGMQPLTIFEHHL